VKTSRKLATRLGRHVGHRGAFLAFLALLDLLYGYSLLVTDTPSRIYDLLLPWPSWGIIWLTVGAFIATGIPMRNDRFQFGAAIAIKAIWGALFVRVWLIDRAERGWVSVVIWMSFALAVLVVAGWPEPWLPSPPPGSSDDAR
jgi:hypothetical protein